MDTAMKATDLVSLSGSLMSLFGILVSLFNIHLGNWLAKLQAIRVKWEANFGGADYARAARRECRYSFAEVYNWQPFIITPIIIAFALSVLYFFYDVSTSRGVQFPGIYLYVYYSFFAIMVALTLFLLSSGWRIGERLKRQIAAEFPKPAPSPQS